MNFTNGLGELGLQLSHGCRHRRDRVLHDGDCGARPRGVLVDVETDELTAVHRGHLHRHGGSVLPLQPRQYRVLAQRTQLEAPIGGVGVDAVAPYPTERVRAGVAQVQMLRLCLPEAAVGQHRPPVHGIEGSGGSGTWSYPDALKFKSTMMYSSSIRR